MWLIRLFLWIIGMYVVIYGFFIGVFALIIEPAVGIVILAIVFYLTKYVRI